MTGPSSAGDPGAGAPPATVPCGKCGRPVGLQAKRCLYCGEYRITAQPGTPEHAAQRAAADEDAKRMARQAVIYKEGMGFGGGRGKKGFTTWAREQSTPVRLLAGAALMPLLLFVPFRVFRMVKEIFRP
jgi:hypothetical protein